MNQSIKNSQPIPTKLISSDYKISAAYLWFVCLFGLLFPFWIFIVDEVSYINQTFSIIDPNFKLYWTDAINQQSIDAILADYPLGTAFFLFPFVTLFGVKGIYLANLFFLLLSALLIRQTIGLLNNSRSGLTTYLLCCLPILFYSRTAMSEMPSLLVISAAFYFYFSGFFRARYIFLFSLLSTFSLWFREANILLFILPLAHLLYRQKERWLILGAGLALGLLPRILSSWLIYGNPFFVKDPGYGFSLHAIPENLPIYAIGVILLFPGLLYFILHFRTSRQQVLNVSIWGYLIFHLTYAYNGLDASGMKAVLLSSRFLIPTLPMAILSLSLVQKNWLTRISKILPWVAMVTVMCFYAIVYFVEKPMKSMKKYLQHVTKQEAIVIADTESLEILEVVTPYVVMGNMRLSDIKHFDQYKADHHKNDPVYIIHLQRSDTDTRIDKQKVIDHRFNTHVSSERIEQVFADSSAFQQFRVYKMDK